MSTRKVSPETWRGRRDNARAYVESARQLLERAEEGTNGNPIMLHVISAAIGFADAVTIKVGGVQNAGEHRDVLKILRSVLGARADGEQLARLGRVIAHKDAVQYGHRRGTIDEARQLAKECDRFARWAEEVMATS